MKYLFVFLSIFISAFLSWLIIPRVLMVTYQKKLFDLPDERKIHTETIPRLGGLPFAPCLLISLSFLVGVQYQTGYDMMHLQKNIVEFAFLICALTLLYLVGVRDDLVGMRYREKFVFQIITAALITLSGLWINNLYGLFGIYELSAWVGIPFTILLIVFITNAINLIDGIDGLACGLSMGALIVLGILFTLIDLWLYSMLAFATFGLLVPFFYFNVFGKVEKQQKIFMGDTGSLTLGFILAFLAIRYASFDPATTTPSSKENLIVAFSPLIIPMFDVIRVVYVRFRNGKGLFSADRNHIHHKFLEIGFSPRKAMISILLVACLFSLVNIVLIGYLDIHLLLGGDILIWILLHFWMNGQKIKRSQLKFVR